MKQKNIIISLGGGCLIATELRKFYLRKHSLPFDWWWNFEDGLEAVTGIISNDFDDMLRKDSYIYSSEHFMWPGKEVLVLAKYPKVALIHSNPRDSDKDKTSLKRRIDRFREFLSSNQPITFIYYREYKDAENADRRFQRLTAESEAFVEMIRKKFNRNNFVLISLFQASPEAIAKIIDSNPVFFSKKNYPANILYDFIAYPSDTSSENKAFQTSLDKQFGNLFLKYKLITSWRLLVIRAIIKAKELVKNLDFIKSIKRKPRFN